MATRAATVKIDAAQLKKLKSHPAVLAELQRYAKKLAQRANASLTQKQKYPDYSAAVTSKGDNPHAAVYTQSNHAKYSNAKHNTLVKLVG